MTLKVGLLVPAHVHAPSYVACCSQIADASIVGVWDHDEARGRKFAANFDVPYVSTQHELLDLCDAVVVTSENVRHKDLVMEALGQGKHVLCEKPLATSVADAEAMVSLAREKGLCLMTAFPCPYSPNWAKALDRVEKGEIGSVQAVCATNQGSCPHDWFVDVNESGGGAIMDHVVHVADLLHRLFGAAPAQVQAQKGHQMYEQSWEDSGIVTLQYESGAFATIDSSWCVPPGYRTWGNVTLNIVGEKGVIEVDLFKQEMHLHKTEGINHRMVGFGSNLDLLMVQEFVAAIREGREAKTSGADGLAATRIVEAAYASLSNGSVQELVV